MQEENIKSLIIGDVVSKKELNSHAKTMSDKFEEIKGDVSEIKTGVSVLTEVMERVEKHVEYTNGCVASNTKWRNYLFAGLMFFTFLFPVLTGVFMYFMGDLKEDLQKDITIQIQENNNEYFK